MGIQLDNVFSTLSYYMGAAYVNDFVQFGRIYRVKIEAGEQAQKVIDDVLKLSVPNAKGDMVPFSSFTKVEERLGMDQISRYNMYSTASITCNVASGSSSGEGIQQMEDPIKDQLGNEFGYEWTSVAYRETQAGNTTTIVFIMALLVAFHGTGSPIRKLDKPLISNYGIANGFIGSNDRLFCHGDPCEHLYSDRHHFTDRPFCEKRNPHC